MTPTEPQRSARTCRSAARTLRLLAAGSVQHAGCGEIDEEPDGAHGEHPAACDVRRIGQAADGLDDDPDCDDDESYAVRKGRQDLGPPVAEASLQRRRPAGEPRREQREGQRPGIRKHVPGVGQHREGVGQDAHDHLDDEEARDERQREPERTAVGTQARVLVVVRVHGFQASSTKRPRLTAKLHCPPSRRRYKEGEAMRSKAYLWIGAAALAAALAAGSALAATSLPRQSSPTQNAPPGPAPGAAQPPTGTMPPLLLPLQAELSSRNVPTLQVASTATGRFIGVLGRASEASRSSGWWQSSTRPGRSPASRSGLGTSVRPPARRYFRSAHHAGPRARSSPDVSGRSRGSSSTRFERTRCLSTSGQARTHPVSFAAS